MTVVLERNPALSSRKRRIIAFMIDHFAIIFLMVSIIFIVRGPNFIDEDNIETITTTMKVLMIPGFFLYFAKDSFNGVSAGKWIMGIMVRDETNPDTIPSFGRLLLRNLFIILWPIEFVVLAISQKKKRIGDKVAKAIIVKNPNKPTKLPRILALAGLGLLFFSFTFLFGTNAIKNSEAYKIAVNEIKDSPEIVTEAGGIKGFGMLPSGSINISNGYGEAQFKIKVIGIEKDLEVNIYLEKEPGGDWKIIEMNK
jgi:uncharacterized RDD family membrane protein YckC